MLGLGLGALAHANWHANYISHENKYWPELSVLQAAHAAEILIKARIAEEHPLLIFETLPAPSVDGQLLSLRQLFETGRTHQFAALPARLWAATGQRIVSAERYAAFGRLRNAIQHFGHPEHIDVSKETIKFIFEVVDPFINESWGLCAIDYNEDYEPHTYLIANVVRHGLPFFVSREAAEQWSYADLDWSNAPDGYREMMEERVQRAKESSPS